MAEIKLPKAKQSFYHGVDLAELEKPDGWDKVPMLIIWISAIIDLILVGYIIYKINS